MDDKKKKKKFRNSQRTKIRLSDGQEYILLTDANMEFENVLDDDDGNFYGVKDYFACKIEY